MRDTALAAAWATAGMVSAPGMLEAGRGDRPRIAVIGAGAFGDWTAFHLLERGADVILIDAFGAGNPRSSSGGETRVIRAVYGPDAIYTDWVLRSFELWREAGRRSGRSFYTQTGVLWMFRDDDRYIRAALPHMAEHGLTVDELDVGEARKRFGQIDFDGIRSVYFEHRAGFLAARDACRLLAKQFAGNGGEYRVGRATPGRSDGGSLKNVQLSGGGHIEADAYVFACGPWLGEMFPDLLGRYLKPTRQEVYLFGAPAGDPRFESPALPVWVDFGERVFYGIPGHSGRGFKLADDTRGTGVNPADLQRTPSREGIERARGFLAERFPLLSDAPLVETRVCQYTNSPDGHFLLDRHPELDNVWLAGAGSGHGFKLAPALGEHMAGLVLGTTQALPRFSAQRLAGLAWRDGQFFSAG